MIIKNKFILFFSLVLLNACSSVYLPSVPNTPLLNEKGQLNAGVHGSLHNNYNFNAAYALGSHFAFVGNHNRMHIDRDSKDIKHRSVELGAGYFGKLGGKQDQIMEFYAGFGRAKNERIFFEKDLHGSLIPFQTENATYDKKFIQFNYSSQKQDNLKLFNLSFDLNFGTAFRLNFVKTDDLILNGIKQANEDNVFIEPIFFTTLGLNENLKIQYTNGSNFGLKSRDFLNANNSIFSLGLIYTFKPQK
ncbi:MAG: hypothetical protein EOO99_09830 [Pedobacter sp.]|nr:MAG: hypothetical protein EOO99_09830 [Pedobacter sp.]